MNKMMGICSLAVLGLAAAVLVSTPTSIPAEDGIHFVYQFKKGHVQQYKVNFKQQIFWGSFSRSAMIDMEVTEKCVDVTEDGLFEMELVFDKVEASIMMFDRMQDSGIGEGLTGQTITYTVDKNGETNDVRALGYIEVWNQIEQMVTEIANQFYVYLPAEDRAEGEKWERTDERDEDGMNITANWEYEFDKFEEVKGRDCAKVKAEVEFGIGGIASTPGGDFNMEGEGDGDYEFFFDAAESMVVKMKGSMEVKSDMVPVSGSGDEVESTIIYEIERELL
jgi:hypothetical protein